MTEGKGTAACYQTVWALWYFKPASGPELNGAAGVGVAPDRGKEKGREGGRVSCWRNPQVCQFPKSSAE